MTIKLDLNRPLQRDSMRIKPAIHCVCALSRFWKLWLDAIVRLKVLCLRSGNVTCRGVKVQEARWRCKRNSVATPWQLRRASHGCKAGENRAQGDPHASGGCRRWNGWLTEPEGAHSCKATLCFDCLSEKASCMHKTLTHIVRVLCYTLARG